MSRRLRISSRLHNPRDAIPRFQLCSKAIASSARDMPPNAIGGQQVFVYGMSSVTGQEAVISIPIAFGSVPTDELSDVATSFCPDMLTPPVPINPLLAQSRG